MFASTRCLSALSLLLLAVTGCAGGGSSGSEPPSLLVSRVSVAVVPGGVQTLTVTPAAGDAAAEPYAAVSTDEGIATASVSGAEVTVRGAGAGAATLTITAASGARRTVPVEVYDSSVLETDGLRITYTDRFERIVNLPTVVYNDAELLLHDEVVGASLWRPVVPAGFRALGSFAVASATDPSGTRAVMVVQASEGSDATVAATGFVPVYSIAWSRCARGATLWRPTCPTGYKAVGMVATASSTAAPPETACIRQDLTTSGDASGNLLSTSHQEVLSWWTVDQPVIGSHPLAYLAPGTFVFNQGTTAPSHEQAANVLKIHLPLLGEAPIQDFSPALTSAVRVEEDTAPRLEKVMLVPCTIVHDDLHADVSWQVANSPFYRLERHVYFHPQDSLGNKGSLPVSQRYSYSSGMTSAASATVKETTGVTMTREKGIELGFDDLGGVSSKVTATVSQELGYESQTGVSELTEETHEVTLNVAPNEFGQIFQQYNRYELYRHVGSELQLVASWEFGINAFVTDTIPYP